MTVGLGVTILVLVCCPYLAPLAFIACVWAEVDRRRLERWQARQRLGQLYQRIHGGKP